MIFSVSIIKNVVSETQHHLWFRVLSHRAVCDRLKGVTLIAVSVAAINDRHAVLQQ